MNSSFEFDNENQERKKKERNKEKPIWNNPELADVFFSSPLGRFSLQT